MTLKPIHEIPARKLRGGFYTPAPVVDACLGRVAAILNGAASVRILEPAAGDGAFVRGLARGIGASPDEVSSPTFTLVQEYAGSSATLYHVDLYRLEPAEIEDLGGDDLVAGDGVVAIEWADRWKGRPDDAIDVRIEDAGEDQRRITIERPR